MSTFTVADLPFVETAPSPAYAASLEQIAPNIGSMIAEQQGTGESWLDSLTRLLPIIAATQQQRELLQIQVDRARQGLPPLDASQYSTGVRVGLDDSTKKLLVGAAVGLGLLFAFSRRRS